MNWCEYTDCEKQATKELKCVGFSIKACKTHHPIMIRMLFDAEIESLRTREKWILKLLGIKKGGDAQ